MNGSFGEHWVKESLTNIGSGKTLAFRDAGKGSAPATNLRIFKLITKNTLVRI